MDQQNDDFEAFLRQFRLRRLDPLPETLVVSRRVNRRWLLIAAAIASAAAVLAAFLWNFGSVRPYATIEAAGDSPYKAGEKIGAGRQVRSGAVESIVMVLEDRTRLEMRSQSELLLEPAADGVRIHLKGGAVIVNAANQRTGHLYVQTNDIVASVVGTLFLVHAEAAGTRVAVIEGSVQVEHGQAVKRLSAGEHMATGSLPDLQSIADEMAWSRNAAAHLALLPQFSSSAPPGTVESRQSPPSRSEVSPIKTAPIAVQPVVTAPIAPPAPEQPPVVPPPQRQVSGPLPEGPGKDILDRACGTCHVPDVVASRRFGTKDEVIQLIDRQVAIGARVPESEYPVLVDYLFANFQAKKKK